jgi:hypothetical protein
MTIGAHGLVGICLDQQLGKTRQHLPRDSVLLLGPVKGNGSDVVSHLVEHVVIWPDRLSVYSSFSLKLFVGGAQEPSSFAYFAGRCGIFSSLIA